ncbi:MAG TPA: cysteine--tRNA ligase [Candidatus Babeliales bacterium]|jgi:cysteinyl-tRNA synthetase|nr:cysteine--tRNA ligase [Candidatus Babeliales bacterium]
MITITNTRSGLKEQFIPHTPGNVTMYVCGITPYDRAHIGHGRCYTSFDLLYRLLLFYSYKVQYCRNFTDIDDKLLKRAQEHYGDQKRYHEIATMYMYAYHEDMQKLNCLKPTYEPRVTDHIPAIISFIEQLINKGYAYQVGGDVYFHIEAFPSYGALSKHTLEDLYAGARVEVIAGKKNPLDFALWKKEPKGQFWQSPWGYGRPGWHIECSVLAHEYLGDYVDIHAGGLDLVFPHHENEIAQSEALLGHIFGTYWMHNGFVQINKEKMSKSLGNFFTLEQIFQQFDPMIIRYYFLTHHYRAPLEFAIDDIAAAQKAYKRLLRVFNKIESKKVTIDMLSEYPIAMQMIEALSNDLNTPALLGIIFESLHMLSSDIQQLEIIKYILKDIVGLTLQPLPETEISITPEIEALIQKRDAARAAKDWKMADALRDQLRSLGFEVHDTKK